MLQVAGATIAWLALCNALSAADEPTTEQLIDKLVEVAEPGVGYSALFSGTEFLPYEHTEHLGTFVWGGTHRARSETLRQLVARGAAAVPALIEHLDDKRRIRLEPLSGMMWIDYPDEYDFNRRTRPQPPLGVNRDGFGEQGGPWEHAITVGDLCFVALGQIVNRNFTASRYQPSGGTVINSPTHSARLRKAVRGEWSKLTLDEHRRRLTTDFEQPDTVDRQIGAYWRPAYYYPDAVEPLVLAELQKPTFDEEDVRRFCRVELYQAAEPARRKDLYDAYVGPRGALFVGAIKVQLFVDLEDLESDEQRRRTPRLTEFSTQPRELLIQLFGEPADVKSTARPPFFGQTLWDRKRLIESLTRDRAAKIGEAVRLLMRARLNDEYFVAACLTCLANRGNAELLVAAMDRYDFTTSRPATRRQCTIKC